MSFSQILSLTSLAGSVSAAALPKRNATSTEKRYAQPPTPGKKNALATLEVGNLSCIPVYYGSTYPLINTYEHFQAWESICGVLPWQGVFAPYNATAEALGSDPTAGTDPNRIEATAFLEGYPNTTAVANKSAAAFMIEQVHKYPGQVSIHAAGATTSVALAVRMDDSFTSLAKELVIMGGYVDDNMYQATSTVNEADINSEINLMIDPEAEKNCLDG